MGKIVVTGSFSVVWDTDELRAQWGEDLTDVQLLEDCKLSVEQDWDTYATTPDSINIDADLVG